MTMNENTEKIAQLVKDSNIPLRHMNSKVNPFKNKKWEKECKEMFSVRFC